MTTLGNFLFPTVLARRTAMERLRWWESRRLAYNAIVGSTGIVALGTMYIASVLPPQMPMHFPPAIILVYALAANLCYSLGWGLEMVARAVWGEQAPELGPALFRQGLAFSVGLTALPMLLAGFSWVGRLVALALH